MLVGYYHLVSFVLNARRGAEPARSRSSPIDQRYRLCRPHVRSSMPLDVGPLVDLGAHRLFVNESSRAP